MAGDWIRFDHSTPDKPEVFRLAELLKIPPEQVVGHLLRVWCWVDQQGRNANRNAGVDVTVTAPALLVNAIARCNGFSDAMIAVGWLVVDKSKKRLRFPNLGEYISETAKRRALAARRVKRFRNATSNAPSVTKALPEKRREEVLNTPLPPRKRGGQSAGEQSPEPQKRKANPRAEGTNPRARAPANGNGKSRPKAPLSDSGIQALAAKLGMHPRTGETMDAYRRRVLEADERRHE